MGLQVEHKCDSCGKLLNQDPDRDIRGSKELTIEQDSGKVTILITVDNMSDNELDYDHPALCCTCLYHSVNQWCETGQNFRRR